jgi:hypothetical protein
MIRCRFCQQRAAAPVSSTSLSAPAKIGAQVKLYQLASAIQMAATDLHQRHPALRSPPLAQQRRRACAQRHAVQAFKPVEPVKQAGLRLAVKRTGCGGLRSQEIIVIFTLNRQLSPPINPLPNAFDPMTDDLPAFPLDHLALRGAPDAPALRFKDKVYSYQLLNHRIGRLAAILARMILQRATGSPPGCPKPNSPA